MLLYLLYIYIYVVNVFINLYYQLVIKMSEKHCEFVVDMLELIHKPIFYLKEQNTLLSNGYESESDYSDCEDIELYKYIKREMSINTGRMNKGKYKKNSVKIGNSFYKKFNLKCGFTFDMDKNGEVVLRQSIKYKLILLSYALNSIKVSDVMKCLDQKKCKGRYLFLFVEDDNHYNENIIIDLEMKKNVITTEDLYFSTITC